MDSTFKDLMRELFTDQSLTEICYINGFQTKCICSSLSNNLVYTEAGLVDSVNFTLDIQIATLQRIPAEGDKVQFRNKFYKIASTQIDSAEASMKLFLVASSKGA